MMGDADYLQLIKQGAEAWNRWREQNPETKPDLTNADLRGAKLEGYNFKDACMEGVRLHEAKLVNANLENANLKNAKIQYANLQSAKLAGANLRGVNFMESNLQGVDLEKADLQGAQFNEDVMFAQANIKGADLRNTTGLMAHQFKGAKFDQTTQFPDDLEMDEEEDFLMGML
jgi:uncharacterized protein YjbI with pentapeptide repeats